LVYYLENATTGKGNGLGLQERQVSSGREKLKNSSSLKDTKLDRNPVPRESREETGKGRCPPVRLRQKNVLGNEEGTAQKKGGQRVYGG